MKRIFKYPVPLQDTFKVSIPLVSAFLCVQMQDGQARVWYAVDETTAPVERSFALVPTGGYIPEKAIYLGTFQMAGGYIVQHLFEVPSP